MAFLFWTLLATLVFIYFGYPALLKVCSALVPRPTHKGFIEPKVTILIAAYNEEASIRKTIENKLALNYPVEKLEIIVVSDASTDATDQIVESFRSKGVKLIRAAARGGKTRALDIAVPHALGEILITSDANSIYHPDAVAELVRNFHDERVGYATGRLAFVAEVQSAVTNGCMAYLSYEDKIRRMESQVGSLVGVNGGIDAMRKCLWSEDPPHYTQDFSWPMKVVEQGYRVVFDEKAVMSEAPLKGSIDEFRMRIRLLVGTLPVIWAMRSLLHPRFGFFSVQFLFHKILRYFAGFLQVAVFVLNVCLLQESSVYLVLFALQILFYLTAFLGALLRAFNRGNLLLDMPYYFCLVNVAAVVATFQYLGGRRAAIWEPRKGCAPVS